MINHLYIDNYRCFTNFEWKPGSLSLLLGDNGTGKSTILDVLETLRDFVTTPSPSTAAFPAHTLTAWDKRREQTFELGILRNEGQYTYRLVIEHAEDRTKNRIKLEQLSGEGVLLYRFEDGIAHLYRDDGTEGPVFPFDWSRSALGTIPERQDNTRLTWFRNYLERVLILSPAPMHMGGHTEGEIWRPDRRLGDFASWLKHLSNDMAFGARLTEKLQPILDGFAGMRFKPTGDMAWELRFTFDYAETEQRKGFDVPFGRLSDGQRCLTALYTALLWLGESASATLLWDEPSNFVSLREIQPWLLDVQDVVDEQGQQCMFISHHPELINTLAGEHGAYFYRESSGPVRVKGFEWEPEDMSPAEIVARGWEE